MEGNGGKASRGATFTLPTPRIASTYSKQMEERKIVVYNLVATIANRGHGESNFHFVTAVKIDSIFE